MGKVIQFPVQAADREISMKSEAPERAAAWCGFAPWLSWLAAWSASWSAPTGAAQPPQPALASRQRKVEPR